MERLLFSVGVGPKPRDGILLDTDEMQVGYVCHRRGNRPGRVVFTVNKHTRRCCGKGDL